MSSAFKLFLIDEAHAKWMSSALYGTEGRFQLKVDNVKPLKFVKPNIVKLTTVVVTITHDVLH